MGKNKQKKQNVVDIDFPGEDPTKKHPDFLEVLQSNPVVKRLTSLILSQSIIDRASDFYMKKTKKEAKLAYRIDGRRLEMVPPPSYLYDSIAEEIRNLVSSKDKTATRIRVGQGKPDNLEAYVSLVHISESGLHLKFSYD